MSDEKKVELVCRDCNATYPEAEFSFTCKKCNAPLRVVLEKSYLNKKLKEGFPSPNEFSFLEDWFDFLPIKTKEQVRKISLGEREASLLPSLKLGKKIGADDLYFKLEMGPTLSLKDRGTALCVLKAKEMGKKTVFLSSSGNNAASIAAYGARAEIPAVVFVQNDVSPAKIAKSMVYGAKILMIDGDMAMASKLSSQLVEQYDWFQCGGPNPYRLSAKRLAAYGIVRTLGRAPDTIILPTGGGAGTVSAYDGFSELYEAGIIDKMPRIVVAQLDACNPIAEAYNNNRSEVTPVVKKKSISDAIMNNNPYWGKYCLEAIKTTGGAAVSVSDEEFLNAIRSLAKDEGIFLEPAGSVSVACIERLKKIKGFEDLGLTVCTITGHGLNFPQALAGDYEYPKPIKPDPEAIIKVLNS